MGRLILVIFLMSLNTCLSSPDTSDADTNSGSETSDTGDIDMELDNGDPNLHNPIVIKINTRPGVDRDKPNVWYWVTT